jgi:GT2 family glycosyltransferase
MMSADPGLAACFGSYDDTPVDRGFLSQYKNLMHHYVHQTAREEASTFWAGCGAIRRDVFLGMGGFSTAYPRPSIEDIELGYRLRAAGFRIRLEKRLQVCHLKRWTAVNLLQTEICDRAIPWARLILERGNLVNDLNLQIGQRYSAVLALLGLSAALASLYSPWALVFIGPAVASLLALNWAFYRYLAERRGLWFVLRAWPWHWLYFVYSVLCFGGVWLWRKITIPR